VRQRINEVLVKAGELEELGITTNEAASYRRQFHSELLGYANMMGYQAGWVYHQFKKKFGLEPRAMTHVAATPTTETIKWIKHTLIAYRKATQK
jgi:hypothetical protein